MMQLLSDMRAAGASIDDAYEWARTNTANVRSRFFSTDLTFYIKGGLVSPVSGFVGNLLGICPLLEIDEEGKLIPVEKVRSKKKVIKRIVECMLKDCKGGAEYSGKVFISHSDCLEDAQAVAALVAEQFPKAQPAEIFWVGTTIGSHTGPGTVALFYESDGHVV